jgi:hypothetical protein
MDFFKKLDEEAQARKVRAVGTISATVFILSVLHLSTCVFCEFSSSNSKMEVVQHHFVP